MCIHSLSLNYRGGKMHIFFLRNTKLKTKGTEKSSESPNSVLQRRGGNIQHIQKTLNVDDPGTI